VCVGSLKNLTERRICDDDFYLFWVFLFVKEFLIQEFIRKELELLRKVLEFIRKVMRFLRGVLEFMRKVLELLTKVLEFMRKIQ